MGDADHLVIEALAQDILQPRYVEKFLEDSVAQWRSATVPPELRRRELEAELRPVEVEIAKLESDLASGAPWQLIRGPSRSAGGDATTFVPGWQPRRRWPDSLRSPTRCGPTWPRG